jgi:purine-binding chemotaxis protein CheW
MTEPTSHAQDRDLELVSFRVGGQDFCVDVKCVREIRGWTQATPLPHSPDYVCGVINLRGTVLPIVELATRLGLKSSPPSPRSVIIVVQIGGRVVGVLVDEVSEIIVSSTKSIQPPPDMACFAVKTFISGILTVEDRMISLLILDELLPRLQEEAA